MKYAELAYDLFHSGFDVLIIDHRGQGRSGRGVFGLRIVVMAKFSDYVDDLEASGSKRYYRVAGASGLFSRIHGWGDCDAVSAT